MCDFPLFIEIWGLHCQGVDFSQVMELLKLPSNDEVAAKESRGRFSDTYIDHDVDVWTSTGWAK